VSVVDVPRRDRKVPSDNATVYSDGSADKSGVAEDAVGGVVEPSHIHRGESSDAGTESVGVVLLGATIGVALVLAALLVAVVVCFVAAGRRRRSKRLTKRSDDAAASRPLPLTPINGHLDTSAAFERRAPNNHYVSTSSLQTRATTPMQPVPPARKDSRSSSIQMVSATASPKPYRTTAAPVGGAGPDCSCATLPAAMSARSCPHATCPSTYQTMITPTTSGGVDDARYLAQRRAAWDAILQGRAGGNTDPSAAAMLLPTHVTDPAADRPLSMSELPPPPDFLLDNGGPELQLSGSVVPAPVRMGDAGSKVLDAAGRTTSPQMLFEVTDGYRSADSVDDDIDAVDYTIRQPSMHGAQLRYA